MLETQLNHFDPARRSCDTSKRNKLGNERRYWETVHYIFFIPGNLHNTLVHLTQRMRSRLEEGESLRTESRDGRALTEPPFPGALDS